MELEFVSDFDTKRKKGYKVVVGAIEYRPDFAGLYAVKVVSEWKTPRWLSIGWFLSNYFGKAKNNIPTV